jgi:hypothetical protein
MHLPSNDLASRFTVIRENLRKTREAMAKGFYQDAMRLAAQVNSSTGQLAAELARYSK